MTMTFHRIFRDVPEGSWRWPNFSPAEIACRGSGKLLVNEPALDKLQALRDRLGKPMIVRSAYRSPEHNRVVGGATRSGYVRLIQLPLNQRPNIKPRQNLTCISLQPQNVL